MILHEGAEAGFYWGGKDATQILPPSPIVPLNEVLPYTGIPLINSDPPPWDATAVDRNPP